MHFGIPLEMPMDTTSFKVLSKSLVLCILFITQAQTSISLMQSPTSVFVGYSSEKKRYKYYNPVKKMMFESFDVTFRETESYFVPLNTQSNASPMTFQNTLEVVITLLSSWIDREGRIWWWHQRMVQKILWTLATLWT
jgi:hypothetical protein